MRAIEKKMNQAILNNENWTQDNTMVCYQDGVSFVYLHGNCIAQVADNYVRLLDGGWRTATTKSRLNAILHECGANFDSIFQKKGEWFFHDSLRSVDIPFENGMVIA